MHTKPLFSVSTSEMRVRSVLPNMFNPCSIDTDLFKAVLFCGSRLLFVFHVCMPYCFVCSENADLVDLLYLIQRILHACSCFIEFIKRVGEKDQMRGLPSILSLFRNEFNKFNDTGARMLDSIYHMTQKILKNCIFGLKTSIFLLILLNVIMDVI